MRPTMKAATWIEYLALNAAVVSAGGVTPEYLQLETIKKNQIATHISYLQMAGLYIVGVVSVVLIAPN